MSYVICHFNFKTEIYALCIMFNFNFNISINYERIRTAVVVLADSFGCCKAFSPFLLFFFSTTSAAPRTKEVEEEGYGR